MLAKLIKYNLKPIFKSILPFIIALFASVIFFNLTTYTIEYVQDENYNIINEIPSSEINVFLHGFANFFICCSLILLFAVAVRSIWRRFKSNFYSDEAYLTHTLPIPRRTLWNSHICSMLITFASVIMVLAINCFILALTRDGQQFLESFGLISGCSHCVGEYYYIKPLSLSFYFNYIFVIFAEFSFLTLSGMTGIILKNRFGKNISLISGILIYSLGSCLLLSLIFFIGNFDYEIFNMFDSTIYITTPGNEPSLDYMTRALLYISCIYTCYSIILYFVDQKLLQHGINLD